MTDTFVFHESLRARWLVADAPAEGSELARADSVWPHLPFTEHARQCLVSAWDHFDVVRLAVDARRMFPTGLNGVLRGGLVASAMALWLLGPDDHELRDQRGLALTNEWYYRRIQYQEELLKIVGDEDGRGQAQIDRLKEDQRRSAELRTKNIAVNATTIIGWSAAHRYGKDTGQHQSAVLEWRRLGGDAHALGWQLMMQEVQWGAGGPGPVPALVTGSVSNIAEPYLCAWHMFRAALRRFDELGRSSAS